MGDPITIRVTMAEPAEDVTVAFFDNYITHAVSLNRNERLQLKPEDKEQKVWSASLTVMDAPDKYYAPGSFLLKATILGGGLKVPLWTANPCELRFKKEAK